MIERVKIREVNEAEPYRKTRDLKQGPFCGRCGRRLADATASYCGACKAIIERLRHRG